MAEERRGPIPLRSSAVGRPGRLLAEVRITVSAITLDRRDIYITSHRNSFGWGGARTFGRGLNDAVRHRGFTTLLIGTTGTGHPAETGQTGSESVQISLPRPRLLWRFRGWRLAGLIARQLRRLPPPRRAFVGMSMHWVVGARRAWPGVRIVYRLPCLLSNCLPFTWPGARPPTLWTRLDYAAIRRAEHRALSVADLVLAPTQFARSEVFAFDRKATSHVAVCRYGCLPLQVSARLRRTHRETLGLAQDDFLVLLAGHCDRNKAFDLAVREMPLVSHDVRLVVVGGGPEHQRLISLAFELGVDRRVHLVGSQPDMEPWYAAADCVLSTSQYDMFPNTIQEGLAHGRPAVVPEHAPPQVYAGAAEVVLSEGGGVLYDRRRPGALADALNRLASDSSLKRRLGEQGHAIAQDRGGWERCVDAILGEHTVRSTTAETPTQDERELVAAAAGEA